MSTAMPRPGSIPFLRARSWPRCTASPTASTWGTVKLTVAATFRPMAAHSSIASMPARVAGILMTTLSPHAPYFFAVAMVASTSPGFAGFVCAQQ